MPPRWSSPARCATPPSRGSDGAANLAGGAVGGGGPRSGATRACCCCSTTRSTPPGMSPSGTRRRRRRSSRPDPARWGACSRAAPCRWSRVRRRSSLPLPASVTATVPIHLAAVGEDPAVLRSLGAVADGLVVAGFGAGHLKADVADAAAELAGEHPGRAGLPDRCRVGAHPHLRRRRLRGGPAGPRAGQRRRTSAPLKARVLLALLLAGGRRPGRRPGRVRPATAAEYRRLSSRRLPASAQRRNASSSGPAVREPDSPVSTKTATARSSRVATIQACVGRSPARVRLAVLRGAGLGADLARARRPAPTPTPR